MDQRNSVSYSNDGDDVESDDNFSDESISSTKCRVTRNWTNVTDMEIYRVSTFFLCIVNFWSFCVNLITFCRVFMPLKLYFNVCYCEKNENDIKKNIKSKKYAWHEPGVYRYDLKFLFDFAHNVMLWSIIV